MPPSTVRLVPHDRAWAGEAAQEAARLLAATSGRLRVFHHIGSTAVTGLAAKPVIDLLGVAADLAELDGARNAIEALGYDWKGEYGLAGRRYCRLDDPVSGDRRIHLHCYQADDPAGRPAPNLPRPAPQRAHGGCGVRAGEAPVRRAASGGQPRLHGVQR